MEYKPHNYQIYNINRIVNDPAVGLFLRPGLGKTSITLSAIHILKYYKWAICKALVIAPKKVAEGTWSREAAKWDHLRRLRVVTVLGSAAKRIKALNTPADVYVINRENIPWLVDYYKQAWPFDMVVLDESTSFKNGRSKRFRALKLVRRFMKRVVLLTGTPSSTGLEDLWAQIYLLDEGQRLGKTITQYRQMYFDPDKRNATQIWSYKPKQDAEEAVLRAISDICVTMKAEDYLELPECVEHEIPVVLDDKTKRAYDKFERDLLLEVNEDVITATAAGVLTGKLLQFCSGAIYDNDKQVVHIHDCKLEAYMELLESIAGEPCITFYGFQHDKDRILAALAKTKLRVRVYKGPEDEDAWNAGEIDVLLVHPSSCAYGLNLQAGGRHIIWFTPNWSFELNDQGKCRLWRQGSPYDKVYVHYLIAQDCVDEDVMAAIQDRQETHETVMDVLKARIKKQKGGGGHMTLRELSQLYWLGKEIEAERVRLAQLREQLYTPGAPVLSDMPKGKVWENRTEKIAAEIADIEAMIADKLAQCACERARLERYIADIPDSLTRQIFTLRFVDCLSWEQCAARIGGGNTWKNLSNICYRYIEQSNKNEI